MKKIIFIIVGIIVLAIFSFYFLWQSKLLTPNADPQQVVLQETYDISKDYLTLRYQTDNVLTHAKDFGTYDAWNEEMTEIISGWKELEDRAAKLGTNAEKLSQEKMSFDIAPPVYAYDKEEISRIVDSAPLGKKIMTLAKHLGVDAKRAQLILNQDQAMVARETWGEEGDTFQTLENDAMRIKNGCKVVGFVGTTVLSGGTSVLATTATVVVGADLTLEIADDEARIALGDKNKVSKIVGQLRTVTEPAAGILTIATIPGNLTKSIDRLSAATFGIDQIRSVVQDEKIIGISIKVDETGDIKAEGAALAPEEVNQWLKDNNASESNETIEEALGINENKEAEIDKKAEEKETIKEETKSNEVKNKNVSSGNIENIANQIIKVVNVSGSSYMMDVCFTPTCWDDLDASPEEDRDLGGIYTMGKVFGNGESFKRGFLPSDLKASGRLEETSANSYKTTLYFAIAPFEGPKNKTIDYGTWLSESVEINAKYGDEPVVKWDGTSLKQAQ
ncbi:hypothetical protein GYA49_04645 [Candidatus Beckwithbacteria bacterium]|nr:hypothetical protein [Candidatus Beckwithbacteria bacterium]